MAYRPAPAPPNRRVPLPPGRPANGQAVRPPVTMFDPEQTMMLPIVDAEGNPRYRTWASSLVTAEIQLDKQAMRQASREYEARTAVIDTDRTVNLIDTDTGGHKTGSTGGVVRAGLLMAIAAVASRLTGFLAKVALIALFATSMVNSSYTMANTLPNIVFELLIGGVLTSVAIPLLARAQRNDPDKGEAYTQRLVTLAVVGLGVATLLAVIAAPLITELYLSAGTKVDPGLTTSLAYLLLPQIFFYGLASLFGAILNTKERFAAQAWAPVLNNLVVIAMAAGFAVIWGSEQDGLDTAQVLFLGLGTTAGIVLQAAIMIPALRRSGFRFKWRFGWDKRMAEAGGLAGWAVIYVLVSQVGYVATTRLLGRDESGLSIFSFASLLFQMPYGILGVSILTAIMPRMSRHAAAGQMEEVKNDMSLANRLSAMALLPVAAAMIALAGAIGVVASAYGANDINGGIAIGVVLGGLAIGLLPLAMSLVQMRVFYAMKDGRTPVLINLIMVAVRVPLLYLGYEFTESRGMDLYWQIAALALATAVSYLVGAIVGEVWLRLRFGPMGTKRVLVTIAKMSLSSAIGGLTSWIVIRYGWGDVFPDTMKDAVVQFLVGATVGVLVIVVCALLLQVEELTPIVNKIRRRRPPVAAATGSRPQPGSVRATSPSAPRPVRTTRPGPGTSNRPSDSPNRKQDQVTPSGAHSGDDPTSRLPDGPASPSVPGAPDPATAAIPAGEALPASADPTAAIPTSAADATAAIPTGPAGSAGAPRPRHTDADPTVANPQGRALPTGPAEQLSPGAVVGGRYRLVNLVAVDASGNRFWRAKDTVLPRDMAVTLLPDGPTVAATVARTLRAGRLNHIGLPQTLDLGTERGQSYIVGQWVEGATLTDLLVSGPLEGEIASSITSKLADAVSEAHRNGIALGAIHPSLVRVNFEGQVRISHVIAHAGATTDQDIKAIGALLYLMLTGTWPLPQQPSTPGGTAAGLPSAPASGGTALPALEVRPTAPPALAALADRALHPEDQHGVRSVAAIAALLRDPGVAPAGPTADPTEALPVAQPASAEKKLLKERRIKLAVATLMITVLAVLIAIVLGSFSKQVVKTLEEPESTSVLISDALPTLEATSGGSALPQSSTAGSTTRTTGSTNTTTGQTSSQSTTAAPSAAPVKIVSATVYDPQGDGDKDYVSSVDQAFDGKAETFWRTWGYKGQFPSLKTGVGLTLELEKAVVPTSITIGSTTPGTRVEIRTATVADPVALTDTTAISSADLGAAPVKIALVNAPKSKFITVFVTQLGSLEGMYGSSLTEISVDGY